LRYRSRVAPLIGRRPTGLLALTRASYSRAPCFTMVWPFEYLSPTGRDSICRMKAAASRRSLVVLPRSGTAVRVSASRFDRSDRNLIAGQESAWLQGAGDIAGGTSHRWNSIPRDESGRRPCCTCRACPRHRIIAARRGLLPDRVESKSLLATSCARFLLWTKRHCPERLLSSNERSFRSRRLA